MNQKQVKYAVRIANYSYSSPITQFYYDSLYVMGATFCSTTNKTTLPLQRCFCGIQCQKLSRLYRLPIVEALEA